jgi:hypothetical protein
MFSRISTIAVTVALMIACVGCGPTTGTVTGVVTIDGKPLKLDSDTRGTVVFQPAGGQGAMATGVLDATGHFKLATGAVSDIAPGKYQVAISVVQLLPPSANAEQGGKRMTPAKYSSAIDSGLQADVVPGENNFKFDLSSVEETIEPPTPSAEAPAETVGDAETEGAPGK